MLSAHAPLARYPDILKDEARRLGFWAEDAWGDILEDRGSQVTFSALGQRAPSTSGSF